MPVVMMLWAPGQTDSGLKDRLSGKPGQHQALTVGPEGGQNKTRGQAVDCHKPH